jgi:hypothetical protein
MRKQSKRRIAKYGSAGAQSKIHEALTAIILASEMIVHRTYLRHHSTSRILKAPYSRGAGRSA